MDILPDKDYKKLYRCRICEKVMTREYSLKVHVLNHLNIKRFECEICHKKFNSKTYLSDHHNLHTGLTPYVCDIDNCGLKFRQRIKLCVHKRQVHNHMTRRTPNHIDSSKYSSVPRDNEGVDYIREATREAKLPEWVNRGNLQVPTQLQNDPEVFNGF
eukprot:CAMPEP_0115031158 /NCGR_PEP_ID=MMETSP0216-20121206/38349_1 /TAXON_ID=223996 /ORGANISM="Protocruzia adherens, Strain Boccale" /LENGTH=157 /DNA_ID=CAMNT_0002408719 /DNA_START=510 /DNA_END=983 /DNA_ORIENTATION=+